MTVFGCLPHKNDAKLPSVYRTVVCRKKSGDLLDNYTRHAYAPSARLLDCGQALCNGPLTDLPLHSTPVRSAPYDTLAAAERKHILAVLEETGWVLGGPHGAAARLGLKRSTLQFRLRKLGITRPGK